MTQQILEKIRSGELPLPKAAATLGAEITELDAEAGTITVQFQAVEAFTNPFGDVQGGFLAAMLDDTMGPALFFTLAKNEIAPTLEMKVNFIKAARVGPIVGHGRIVSRGRSVCVLEAELMQDDKLIARSSATTLIRKRG